jgi:hypothetical protein
MSNTDYDLDELEQMRKQNEIRLKELEAMYMSKKMNSSVGRIIRDKMGYPDRPITDRSTPRKKNNDRD